MRTSIMTVLVASLALGLGTAPSFAKKFSAGGGGGVVAMGPNADKSPVCNGRGGPGNNFDPPCWGPGGKPKGVDNYPGKPASTPGQGTGS